MSKDRNQHLAVERHKTKIGAQRKALAGIANAALDAIKERDEGRAAGPAMDDLKRREMSLQAAFR